MAHKQHPIGSGFTAAATADDVLAGIDLTGIDLTGIDLTGKRATVRFPSEPDIQAGTLPRSRRP